MSIISPSHETMRLAAEARELLRKLRHFADAPSDKVNDERWHFDVLPAMRNLETALAAEAEKRIQSAATPPRSGQPGSERTLSPEPVQAAPFPHPQAHPSQAAAATQAMSAVTRVPPSSIDPAFLAATRESQGQPIDAEPRRS